MIILHLFRLSERRDSMSESDEYMTLVSANENEIKIKKSRFIANAFHIESKEDLQKYINKIRKKFFDARHHPYAYITRKDNFRYSDDDEPAGTSGLPIYEAICKYNFTDTLVIVTRYFGGIKLGTGGLKRAYFQAADNCLKNSISEKKYLYDKIDLSVDFSYISQVMKLFEKYNVISDKDYSEECFSQTISIRKSLKNNFINELINYTNGKIKFF